jgi:hypothetical protein
MGFFATRLVPVFAAVLLMLVLKPWNLQWWIVDAGVGLVLFVAALFRDSSKPEPRDVWISFAIAAAVWFVGFLVARYNGLTLEELVSDQSVNKHVRRIPDYAVVLGTFAALFSVRSALPSPSREQSSDA